MKFKYLIEFYGTIGVPLLYFAVLYATSLGGTLDVPLVFRFFGLLVSGIGIFFWLLSYLQLGRSFGVLPRENKRITTGLYSRYKHPMYIGITLTFFGLSLGNQSVHGIVATLLLLLPVLVLRAYFEERQLS